MTSAPTRKDSCHASPHPLRLPWRNPSSWTGERLGLIFRVCGLASTRHADTNALLSASRSTFVPIFHLTHCSTPGVAHDTDVLAPRPCPALSARNDGHFSRRGPL